MKKRCTQCGRSKTLSQFYADVNQTDTHKDECKSCNTARSSMYYYDHKTHILAQARTYAQEHKSVVAAIRKRGRERKYKLVLQAKSKPCMDCGEIFIPFVMDLDHVRGRKLFGLAALGTRSKTSIKKEIAKCDAVCSNCHRVRTWNRMIRSKS